MTTALPVTNHGGLQIVWSRRSRGCQGNRQSALNSGEGRVRAAVGWCQPCGERLSLKVESPRCWERCELALICKQDIFRVEVFEGDGVGRDSVFLVSELCSAFRPFTAVLLRP